MLAAGYEDGSIRIWDLESHDCRVTFSGHKTAVTCLDFDCNSTRLVSGSKVKHRYQSTKRNWKIFLGHQFHVEVMELKLVVRESAFSSPSGCYAVLYNSRLQFYFVKITYK